MRWPLDKMEVTSSFGTRKHPVTGETKMHYGVDLRAATGTPIYLPTSGRIIDEGEDTISGRYVVADLDDGTRHSFVHLEDAAVPVGTQLAGGALVGWTGASGRVTGPHLHWGVRKNGAWVDPMKLPYQAPAPLVASVGGLLVGLTGWGLVNYFRRRR